MRYALRHRTTYRYAEAVNLSYHTLRLTPRALNHQRVHQPLVLTSPPPASLSVHRDYFGNGIISLIVDGPHDELVIDAQAIVEVDRREWPFGGGDFAALSDFLRGGSRAAIEAGEFVHASPFVPETVEAASYGRESFANDRPVLAAVSEIVARIHRDFVFDSLATGIATPLADVLRGRRGVCQDFAHVAIAALRAIGVPARYVSGYIRTIAPAGQARLVGADASHAWIAAFVPTLGWLEFDPTNNLVVSDEHVTLGWGRDYGDVSPVRGVVLGGGRHQLDVSVELAETA